ncbi:MAG: glycine cleavage T C-terminal barrel domain-containing protein [Pseudomonadota bacterium]
MAHIISPSPRVRRSPFYEKTVEDGVVSFAPYNHMLMPTGYGDPMAEYDRLINGVAMWDVAVERQVEIAGPDAAKLAQALSPRIIADMPVGMGWYVPICDHRGVIINDPILLKVAEDRYWFSIADSDLLLWARAVAGERGYVVNVFEPDVSPLAVQGPKAEDVVASVFGDWVRELTLFQFRDAELAGMPLMLARSGWSKQGGFEIYLMDGKRAGELWDTIKDAGAPYDIGPGCPNNMERVESGLLSWGGDTDDETNPYEVRMGRFVDLSCPDGPDGAIGIEALRRIKEEGPRRWQLGVKLRLEDRMDPTDKRSEIRLNGDYMGMVTAHAWSPRLETNIGMCLVSREIRAGDVVEVYLPDGRLCEGEMTKLPFI